MSEDKFLKIVGKTVATVGLIGVLAGFGAMFHEGKNEERLILERQNTGLYSEQYKTLWDEQQRSRHYSLKTGALGFLSIYVTLLGFKINKVGGQTR